MFVCCDLRDLYTISVCFAFAVKESSAEACVSSSTVRPLSISAWRDISVFSGEISVKLGTNVHHVSGHCWKCFQGQSSRSWPDQTDQLTYNGGGKQFGVWCRGSLSSHYFYHFIILPSSYLVEALLIVEVSATPQQHWMQDNETAVYIVVAQAAVTVALTWTSNSCMNDADNTASRSKPASQSHMLQGGRAHSTDNIPFSRCPPSTSCELLPTYSLSSKINLLYRSCQFTLRHPQLSSVSPIA